MTVLIGFLICRPIAKNWDPTAAGHCGNRMAGYTAVSVVNVVIDCLMLVLPLPMVFRLQVKPGYKWALCGIFGIGLVTIVFSVIRLVSLRMIDFDDFSYTVPLVMAWTTAENGVIIMVASSALLRPVFDRMLGRLASLSGSRSKPSASANQCGCGTGASPSLEQEDRDKVFAGDGDTNQVGLSRASLTHPVHQEKEIADTHQPQSDGFLELGVLHPHSRSGLRTAGSRQPILNGPAALAEGK